MKHRPNERRTAKLEMQSVGPPSPPMAEPTRGPRPVARQVAIHVEDVDDEKEQHSVEHYFMRLIWTAKLHGLFFSPKSGPFVWMINLLFNCITLAIISVALFYEANLVLDNVNTFDIEISTMLCSIVWIFQSVISMVGLDVGGAFMIWWQLSGRLWKYFENVIINQKGEAISFGSNILKRTVCFSHFTNITVISIVLLVHYGPETIRSEFNKYEIFTNWLMKPLHTISVIHVCMAWNTTVFMYNILIDGCYLEAKHFNKRVKNLIADSDKAYCRELIDLIACHSRIASNIRQLDKMMMAYSFVMISTAIPSFITTLNMLAQRVNEYIDFLILGLPSVGSILAAFLGITLAPARLYEEMYKSKNYLCQNTNIWKSSDSDLAMPIQKYKLSLAMALSSHMEQPNLGLTILGFAVLSKPFILAIFSVLIMLLSLVIEIVPTIKEFVEDLEEEAEDNISTIINATLS